MAIFYPHIKGFDGGAYTWIDFQHSDNDIGKLPLVKYNTNHIKDSATSLGRLVATGVPTIFERSVSLAWEDDNANDIHRSRLLKFATNSADDIYKAWIQGVDNGLKLSMSASSLTSYIKINHDLISLSSAGGVAIKGDHLDVDVPNSYIYTNGFFRAEGYLISGPMKGGVANGAIYANDYVESATYIQAPYFNATSDKRAKIDIQLLSINALDLIKSVQLYSFKYKDSNKPSIGIIAQEVQNIDLQGFSLVDNTEASGENGDYMTVKESKLVYILWKAVQELSAEVEELKQQLKKD